MVLHTLTKQHCYKSSVAIRSRDIWSKHCPLQRVISSKRGNRYRLTCGITQLPSSFRQPHSVHSPPASSCAYLHITSSQSSHSFFLSLPRPFTPDLKLISFTNPFIHSHSYSFWTAFTDLNLYWIKGALVRWPVGATVHKSFNYLWARDNYLFHRDISGPEILSLAQRKYISGPEILSLAQT